MSEKKKIAILGSTGSIGQNAVKVVEHLASQFDVVGVAAKNNIDQLAEQAAKLNCRYAVTGNPEKLAGLKKLLPRSCKALAGEDGLLELAACPDVDMVLCAIVGTGGLVPVLEAVKTGKDIAIASKEVLVAAGELVMEEVRKSGVNFLPVDSEHSAVFQCLEARPPESVNKIILTASGGPFRDATAEEMAAATYECALAHPTWDMGPKVTIDSATLMNKALEIVEARWLFNVPGSAIEVVIHPQSVIHSMVEFIDGTILAQLSSPDMRFPIQYALTWPEKHRGGVAPLDFRKYSNLTFETPDRVRFPSLDFAYSALEAGGVMPAVMNAANEAAVERFSAGEIRFPDIWKVIEATMTNFSAVPDPSLEDIITAHSEAKSFAEKQPIS